MGCSKFGEECHEFMCGFSENGMCTNGKNEYFGSIESSLPKTNCDIPMSNVKSPKTELISAAEAYKKTQEVLKEDDIKSLKEINSKILEATKKGRLSITGLGKISFGAREKLESLGYEIITGFDLNESYYLISWEREEN